MLYAERRNACPSPPPRDFFKLDFAGRGASEVKISPSPPRVEERRLIILCHPCTLVVVLNGFCRTPVRDV